MINVGKILRSQGERGELRLRFYDKKHVNFSELTRIHVGTKGDYREFRIEALIPRGHDFDVRLEGVDSLSQADALSGFEVLVTEEMMASLGEDRYYLFQLRGCAVLNPEGKRIGIVVDVLSVPAQDLLVLDCEGKEVLIPFHNSICREVDLAKKEIRVDPPDGLLELDEI